MNEIIKNKENEMIDHHNKYIREEPIFFIKYNVPSLLIAFMYLLPYREGSYSGTSCSFRILDLDSATL